MRIYQYVMIAKMVLADKPTNKESESELYRNKGESHPCLNDGTVSYHNVQSKEHE